MFFLNLRRIVGKWKKSVFLSANELGRRRRSICFFVYEHRVYRLWSWNSARLDRYFSELSKKTRMKRHQGLRSWAWVDKATNKYAVEFGGKNVGDGCLCDEYPHIYTLSCSRSIASCGRYLWRPELANIEWGGGAKWILSKYFKLLSLHIF